MKVLIEGSRGTYAKEKDGIYWTGHAGSSVSGWPVLDRRFKRITCVKKKVQRILNIYGSDSFFV